MGLDRHRSLILKTGCLPDPNWKLRTVPGVSGGLVSLSKKSPCWESRCWRKATNGPFLTSEIGVPLKEAWGHCLCCEQVCNREDRWEGLAVQANWDGKFVPSWMIPVLFLGYFSELTGKALRAFPWTPALALTTPPCSDLLLHCEHGLTGPALASLCPELTLRRAHHIHR